MAVHRQSYDPQQMDIGEHPENRSVLRVPGRGPERGWLGEIRLRTPEQTELRHLHHRLQLKDAIVRTCDPHIREIHRDKDHATFLQGIPATPSFRGHRRTFPPISDVRRSPLRRSRCGRKIQGRSSGGDFQYRVGEGHPVPPEN